MTEVTVPALAGHQFLRGLPERHLARLAGAATLVTVRAGERFFHVGGVARSFWLIRAGQVELDLLVPGDGRLIVETLARGSLLGLSWFFEPYQWQFGAVAVQPTEAFQVDGLAVRRHCDADPDFGYQITRRLIAVAAHRLQATRMRMVDVSVRADAAW